MFNKMIVSSLLLLMASISLLVGANENMPYIDNNFSKEGYRSKNYRSPTPTETTFAEIVNAEEILKFSQQNESFVLVDVRPLTWDGSTFIQTKPHKGIPNSIWLPNVGFGIIDEKTMSYLVDSLNYATGNDNEIAIIFYCKVDCWMSWNAARRASSLGFKNIGWYKNGIEDWQRKNLGTQSLHPRRFPK